MRKRGAALLNSTWKLSRRRWAPWAWIVPIGVDYAFLWFVMGPVAIRWAKRHRELLASRRLRFGLPTAMVVFPGLFMALTRITATDWLNILPVVVELPAIAVGSPRSW